MKISIRSFGALAIVPLLLSGCVSVDVTKDGGRETVLIENSVCKIFCSLPLVSGDPDYPNQEVGTWFENTMTLETNLRLLDQTVCEQGARTFKDLQSYRADEQIIPFILKRYMLYTSAEIVR